MTLYHIIISPFCASLFKVSLQTERLDRQAREENSLFSSFLLSFLGGHKNFRALFFLRPIMREKRLCSALFDWRTKKE